jgi:hypothetical protein
MAENKAQPWPRDPLAGAQLITAYAHGLMTGPCGVAFMRQSALGPGADLDAKRLIDTAEILAIEATRRSSEIWKQNAENMAAEATRKSSGTARVDEDGTWVWR